MRKSILSLIVFLASLLGASAHAGPSYSAFYVFGDSLSDTGNAALAVGTASPPYTDLIPAQPYDLSGTFSNGSVWSDYLAASLGVPSEPSLALGTNFAVGGSRTDVILSQVVGGGALPGYLTSTGGIADPAALYAIWGGGNDLRDVLMGADPTTTIGTAIANLQNSLVSLITAGASEFIVLNAPDLGLVPAVSLSGGSAAGTLVSQMFNSGLSLMLDGIEGTFGVTIHEVDTFGLLNRVVTDPASFGLLDVASPCIALGPCSEPDTFLFWDGIHPTTIGHALIAEEAYRVAFISVPAGSFLFLIGAFSMLWVRAARA